MKKKNVTKNVTKNTTEKVTNLDESFVNGEQVTIESEGAIHDQATDHSPVVDEREVLIKRAHAAKQAASVGLMTQEEADEHWAKAVAACKPSEESLTLTKAAKESMDKAAKVAKAAQTAFAAGLIDEETLTETVAKADAAKAAYTAASKTAKGFSMNGSGGGPRYKGQMSGFDAAILILSESEKPLNPSAIAKAAIERGLWAPDGLTPAASLSATLQADIKKGDKARFIKTGPGHYTVRKTAN